ncbi:MAG: STY0301 family protein [Thermomonas sp.]
MITTLLLIAAQGASPTLPLACPDHITTKQTLTSPAEGWETSTDTFSVTDKKLHGTVYGFSDGPPEEMALLKPASILKSKGGLLSTWVLDQSEQTWLICGYEFTTIQLSKALPAKLKKCFVQTDGNGNISAWCK